MKYLNYWFVLSLPENSSPPYFLKMGKKYKLEEALAAT